MKPSRKNKTALFTAFFILLIGTAAFAQVEISNDNRIGLQASLGMRNPALNPNTQPWSLSSVYCAAIGYGINEEMMLFAEFDLSKIYNDTLSDKTWKTGKDHADRYWKIRSYRLKAKYSFLKNSILIPYLTGGVGFSSWSIHDIVSGDKLIVTKESGDSTEYSATEMFFCIGGGYDWYWSDNFCMNLDLQFNRLLGIGADFSSEVNDYRSHAYAELKVGFTFYFGLSGADNGPDYDRVKTGISDREQIELDYDRDGVVNSLDLCPNTPPEARHTVDEYGCPADSDGDGLPDYLDKCPLLYAEIRDDSTGCPPDQDGDMVPDSLDACPDSPAGFQVDQQGCPFMDSIFIKQILHPQYSNAGQALDYQTMRALDNIVAKLRAFPEVTMTIRGYSDNSLGAQESLLLSEREAEKIKSYFLEQGIFGARITTLGKGAVDFIDTNSSNQGKANNHRIEIVFEY